MLCDELEARRACRAMDIPVIGSIGLIVEACRAGRVALDLAETALAQLPEKGRLHASRVLIAAAVAAVKATRK